MEKIKNVWHWWWGWNTEKVENWLEEMEKNGWNLTKVDFFQVRFSFKKGKSEENEILLGLSHHAGRKLF